MSGPQRISESGIEAPTHRCVDDEQFVQLAAGMIAAVQAESLLLEIEGCPRCRAGLAEAGAALRGNLYPSISQASIDPGDVVAARYDVTRFIGRGGMGEVYEVSDRELSERVAFKIIRPEFSKNPAVVRRFKQELRLARKVVHPNVCRVFDLGTFTSRDGHLSYYHTMELVNGRVLSSWMRRGPVAIESTLSIARQLAAGLAAIHAHGIIHRDLKPENIMICDADQIHAKILDFGIARPLERLNGLVTTARDTRLGTPDYMAPEQLTGRSSSTASDVYSFGLIIYEMLTGQHPCPLQGTRTTLNALNEFRPAPPEQRRPDVPVGLSRLVMECLHDDPLCRPATGAELVRRLAEVVPTAPPRSFGDMISGFVRRRLSAKKSSA